jgi:hypothetical protein
MDTNDFIAALAADTRRPAVPLATVWWGAAGLSIVLAAFVFQTMLGVRPDIAAAVETPRFLFKFVVTIVLAAGAFGAARALSRPGSSSGRSLAVIVAAPALLIAAVFFELMLLPVEVWGAKTIGMNNLVCLFYIPLIGIGPLAVFVLALRYGAASRPAVAGAVAGLLAGGISATFYASHCTDDSPLFVIVWYTIAITILAVVGALAAHRFARW